MKIALKYFAVIVFLVIAAFSFLISSQILFFLKNIPNYDNQVSFGLSEKKCKNIKYDEATFYLARNFTDSYFKEYEINFKNLYFSYNTFLFKGMVKLFISEDTLMNKYDFFCSKIKL